MEYALPILPRSDMCGKAVGIPGNCSEELQGYTIEFRGEIVTEVDSGNSKEEGRCPKECRPLVATDERIELDDVKTE